MGPVRHDVDGAASNFEMGGPKPARPCAVLIFLSEKTDSNDMNTRTIGRPNDRQALSPMAGWANPAMYTCRR
jgi:hypothetical protein